MNAPAETREEPEDAGSPGEGRAELRVAHLMRHFLQPTETFLYSFATGVPACTSYVVTEDRRNEESFPFDETHILSREDGGLAGRFERLSAWFCDRPSLRVWGSLDSYRPHLRASLRRIRPELVHAHFGWMGAWALRSVRALGLPMLTSFYGLDLTAMAERPRFQKSYRRLFEEGSLFLTEGPAMAETLASISCPREKIRLQPLAIDLDRFQFQDRKIPQEGEDIVLIQIASLREKKGHRYVFEALARLLPQFPTLRLDLVGHGPLEDELRALAKALGIEARIRWLGLRSHEDCAALLEEAQLFVHPSVLAHDGDREGGAPTILLEAQAAGLPIVGTKHDDIPFVVKDGASGILVEERDGAALADAIASLCKEPKRWKEMSAAGRAHVESRFSREQSLSTLRGHYEEALRLQSP